MIRRRTCEDCGEQFAPTRIDARFHTDACRYRARRNADALPVRIRAAKNALSALVEVGANEDEAWWALTLDDLLDHIRTEAARIGDETEVP
ncbi:hypothetical protein GCM10027059_26840 [Myceligenerans halotolerans]